VKKLIKKFLLKIPFFSKINNENKQYKNNACYPPGHYYSPIILVEDIVERQDVIWGKKQLPGKEINLNLKYQLELINAFESYYSEIPFKENKEEKLRYYFKNSYYSYTDGIILYSFLRHFKPGRLIEIGSGYSSALILDTIDMFLHGENILTTFIEPYPDRLYALINEADKHKVEILEHKVQNIPIELFSQLKKDDVLFIDSSHVCKTGSDVNHILFNILPILNKDVLIHFHDIFYPFEYPKEWVLGGRNWNEIYLLKAFLMNNNNYEIIFFSHYLHSCHSISFKNMPLAYNDWGCNFWIRKIS
jgi:hypothetical protein